MLFYHLKFYSVWFVLEDRAWNNATRALWMFKLQVGKQQDFLFDYHLLWAIHADNKAFSPVSYKKGTSSLCLIVLYVPLVKPGSAKSLVNWKLWLHPDSHIEYQTWEFLGQLQGRDPGFTESSCCFSNLELVKSNSLETKRVTYFK